MDALVVECDEYSGRLQQLELSKLGFKCSLAKDTASARTRIEQETFDLVSIDADCPELNTPLLCDLIHARQNHRYTHVLISSQTSLNDPDFEALTQYANDTLQRPLNTLELKSRFRSAKNFIDTAKRFSSRQDRLTADLDIAVNRNVELTADLQLAAKLQQQLLPQAGNFGDVEASGYINPAQFIAGDAFDYFKLNDNVFAFYIVDVMGHGAASAMISFSIHSHLNPKQHGLCRRVYDSMPNHEAAVVATVRELNREFQDGSDECRYFTMTYGLLDCSTGKVTLCNAGHPPAIHHASESNESHYLGSGGFPVGMFEEATYHAVSCQLAENDRLVLYSDGATECESPSGEQFGEQRLVNTIAETSTLPVSSSVQLIDESLNSWSQDSAFEDDVSLLYLAFRGHQAA